MFGNNREPVKMGIEDDETQLLGLSYDNEKEAGTSSNTPAANHPLPESFAMFRTIAGKGVTNVQRAGPGKRKDSEDSSNKKGNDRNNSAENKEVKIGYKYNVIELSELQDNIVHAVRYLCIPNSWIKWHNNKDGKVTFFYPNERQFLTNERVKNNENYSSVWKVNIGTVKFTSDSCESAFAYMNQLNTTKYLNRLNADASTPNTKNSASSSGHLNTPVTNKIASSHQNEFHKLFNEVQTTLDSNFKQIFTLYTQTCEILRKMSSYINNQTERSISSSPSTSKGVGNLTKRKYDAEAPLNKRPRLATSPVVLPSEYDVNNSRWTLKHRKPGPGLTELVSHTRIYVNEIEFNTCLLLSDNYKELVKMLLKEIFTINALKVCSVDGRKRAEGTRPALDENAKKTLIKYVADQGIARGWEGLKTANILSSIRTALQSFKK